MNESATRHTITALYEHPSAAQDAATALVDSGFDQSAVTVQPSASEEVLRTERNQDPDVVYRGVTSPDRGGALGFVIGFLGGGLFGLMLGSGALNVMGREAAMAVGPFWSAVIGAVILGLGLGLAGYFYNSPLPQPEPPQDEPVRLNVPTIVSVIAEGDDAQRAREAIDRSSPARVTVWHADNGDWTPLAAS